MKTTIRKIMALQYDSLTIEYCQGWPLLETVVDSVKMIDGVATFFLAGKPVVTLEDKMGDLWLKTIQ